MLATDIYKQVIGQQNFQMGAVVGMVLLIPAIAVFAADRITQRRQVRSAAARRCAAPFRAPCRWSRARGADWTMLRLRRSAYGSSRISAISFWASVLTCWPYNLTPTLEELRLPATSTRTAGSLRELGDPGGVDCGDRQGALFSSAPICSRRRAASAGGNAAWRSWRCCRAVPGLVLGLGYMFFFNAGEIRSGFIYATMAILVLNTGQRISTP